MNRIHYKPCCTTPAMLCHPLLDHSTSFYVVHSCRATPCHLVPSLLCNDSPAMWYHPLSLWCNPFLCGATQCLVVPTPFLVVPTPSMSCHIISCQCFHVAPPPAMLCHPCCVKTPPAMSCHILSCHAFMSRQPQP